MSIFTVISILFITHNYLNLLYEYKYFLYFYLYVFVIISRKCCFPRALLIVCAALGSWLRSISVYRVCSWTLSLISINTKNHNVFGLYIYFIWVCITLKLLLYFYSNSRNYYLFFKHKLYINARTIKYINDIKKVLCFKRD